MTPIEPLQPSLLEVERDMLAMEFVPCDNNGILSGFAMGHMRVVGTNGEVDSALSVTNQSMMIFLTVVELLDGLRRFLRNKENREYRLVGVDSSFSVRFQRLKNGNIKIWAGETVIEHASESDLRDAVYRDVRSFLDETLHRVPDDEAAKEDLLAAFRQYENETNRSR